MTAELTHASPDCEGELFCLEALFPDALAYAASKDPDTMYLHQAMKEPDKNKFLTAMMEEVDAQLKGGNFSLILRSKVLKGATILPAVWQMKRKCRIQTQEVYKWKSHSQVGTYLGRSPQHARDISLVLNLETGLVSPQFHVKLDSNFQTLREKGACIPTSTWQVKQVWLHSTANHGHPMGPGPRNWTNGWSTLNAAARGSATSCTHQ